MRIYCDAGHKRVELATFAYTSLGWLTTHASEKDKWFHASTQIWSDRGWFERGGLIVDYLDEEFLDGTKEPSSPKFKRHVFECPRCGRNPQFSGDKLDPILTRIDGLGITEAALADVEKIVEACSR